MAEVASFNYINILNMASLHRINIGNIAAWNKINIYQEGGEASVNLFNGLISYFKLDETIGDAIDSYGGYDGTSEVITYSQSGILNTAYRFNGTSSVVHLDASSVESLTAGSISLWINPSTLLPANERIIHKGDSTGATTGFIIAGIGTGGDLIGGFEVGGEWDGLNWSASTNVKKFALNLSVNTWYHLALTYNSTDKLKLYVNGVNGEENNTDYQWSSGTGNYFTLGRRAGAASAYFNGVIDEVGIWNRALTQAEVSTLYNNGNGYPFVSSLLTGLLDYYNFNEIEGSTFLSQSTYANHITLAKDISVNLTGILSGAIGNDGVGTVTGVATNSSVGWGTISDEISISCWARFIMSPCEFASSEYVFNFNGYVRAFSSYVNDRMYFYSDDTSTTTSDWTYGSVIQSADLNEWNHYVFICPGETEYLKIYKNGLEDTVYANRFTTGQLIGPTGNQHAFLCNTFGSTSNSADAMWIDEVGIWNRRLTELEIKSLYNNGVGLTYPFTTTDVSIYKRIGYDKLYASTSTTANRRAVAAVCPEDGSIQSITIYHSAGSGNMLLGIYQNIDNGYLDASAPGVRLGITPETSINGTAGWQTIDLISPVEVSANQNIWIAWVFSTNPGMRYEDGLPYRAQSAQTWSGGMPDPFGALSAYNLYRYSIYCTYTT